MHKEPKNRFWRINRCSLHSKNYPDDSDNSTHLPNKRIGSSRHMVLFRTVLKILLLTNEQWAEPNIKIPEYKLFLFSLAGGLLFLMRSYLGALRETYGQTPKLFFSWWLLGKGEKPAAAQPPKNLFTFPFTLVMQTQGQKTRNSYKKKNQLNQFTHDLSKKRIKYISCDCGWIFLEGTQPSFLTAQMQQKYIFKTNQQAIVKHESL